MTVYNESTKPIIDHYKSQGKLKTINADGGADMVKAELLKILSVVNEKKA